MNKEELIKRKLDLEKEFEELSQARNKGYAQIKEMEDKLNQLSGAFNEIEKLIKEMEETNEDKAWY